MYFWWSLVAILETAACLHLSLKLGTWAPIVLLLFLVPAFPVKVNKKENKSLIDEDTIPYDKDADNINNITRFINEFKRKNPKEIEDLFLNGYCYWFAWILHTRFGGRIYYIMIDNHFITKIHDRYWDITGEVRTEKLQLIPWDEFKYYDSSEYNTIMRDCIKKSENMW